MTDTPDPVTVPPDADPLAVLRTMAKFLPGEDRGVAEIRDGDKIIGHAALMGHPERLPMPVFDTATREVECIELATWLKARGYEASACKWEQDAPSAPTTFGRVRLWRLLTGKSAVPALPAAPLFRDNSGEISRAQMEMLRGPPIEYGGIDRRLIGLSGPQLVEDVDHAKRR